VKILEETNDGFKIAEAEFEMRGPGELLGASKAVCRNLFRNLAKFGFDRQARELVSKILPQRRERRRILFWIFCLKRLN